MHNLYGTRKLTAPEIKGSFTLSNNMFCVWGLTSDEGLSIDVYEDKAQKLLIGLEHGITVTHTPTTESLQSFMESCKEEFEDSVVYYYGPKECSFTPEELTKPIPKKTGPFAKKKERK